MSGPYRVVDLLASYKHPKAVIARIGHYWNVGVPGRALLRKFLTFAEAIEYADREMKRRASVRSFIDGGAA